VTKSRGVVMFDFTGHNIFMATHAHMFQYLPITKESAVKADMYGASAVFISFSKQVGETFQFYDGSLSVYHKDPAIT